MTVMSSSDPCIAMVDLNELLPGRGGVHLLVLLTASWTINKTLGCSIWNCRCYFDTAAQVEQPSEGGGWILRRGQQRGGDPQTGGNGRAARLDQEPRNPRRRVLRISFVFWSTDRKRNQRKPKASDFWGHRWTHTSREDNRYILIDVLEGRWRKPVLFLVPFRCLPIK